MLLNPAEADDLTTLRSLISGTDLLIESLGAERARVPRALARRRSATANPRLAVVRISPFGQHGPYVGVPGHRPHGDGDGRRGCGNHGIPGVPPVQTGGRLHEYTIAAYAACAGLTAVRAARVGNKPAIADLSALEVMLGTIPYPMMMHEAYVRLGLPIGEERYSTIPGIVPCADGWVGINALTGQHFQDICAMLDVVGVRGPPDRAGVGRRRARRVHGPHPAVARPPLGRRDRRVCARRSASRPRPWATARSSPRYAQFMRRPFFTTEPDGDLTFPGPPWRLSGTPGVGPAGRADAGHAAETAGRVPVPRESP